MAGPGAQLIRLRPGIEWRTVSGEVVALDLESSAYLAVNDAGSILWPLVVEGASAARLAEELIARYELDADQARHDVAVFVDELRSLSLVEVPG